MIVIDASPLLSILLREPAWKTIASRLEPSEACSSSNLQLEIGNTLSSLVRRGLVTPDIGYAAWKTFEQTPIRLFDIPYQNALTLAFEHRIYADAYVIAVARRHRLPLLTLDAAIARVAIRVGVTIKEV